MGSKFLKGDDVARCLLPFHKFESGSKYVGRFPVASRFAIAPGYARFLN